MLRITLHGNTGTPRLQLEGRLEGDWVAELNAAWNSLGRKAVVVDLNAVHFIDSPGRLLLQEMYRTGSQLVANLPLTHAVVKEIQK